MRLRLEFKLLEWSLIPEFEYGFGYPEDYPKEKKKITHASVRFLFLKLVCWRDG